MRTIDESELPLRWTGRISLTPRILFVNIFALALLAGGFFYLDFYRTRIIDGRLIQASREARVIGQALLAMPRDGRDALLARLAETTGRRIRVYGPDGQLRIDTRALGVANFRLRDPDRDPWNQYAARFLDAAIDTIVGADRAPLYRERAADKGFDWPDVATARDTHTSPATVWRAPDRTPVITAASPLGAEGVVLTTINARDITQYVRVERYRLSIVLAVVSLVSILLSLFLARTIVQPLRKLARAAVRVRRGRDREVVVPRLPSRRDEIGMLARALSDMSQALRARIDATEAFAADVTHELKNPLASLRSAVDTLSNVKDPDLQERLLAVVRDDIHRLDRLITDISDASRLDAQLSRAKFEPVDLYAMTQALIDARQQRGIARGIRLTLAPPADAAACVVLGEDARLERVVQNLLDNAVSFSPDGGTVATSFARSGDILEMHVEDEGPGVAPDAREAIFRRFHSIRPQSEEFGKHSGLGLAIARTVVEGHQGAMRVESRRDGRSGARFVVELPISEG